jgi:hypothetical protein
MIRIKRQAGVSSENEIIEIQESNGIRFEKARDRFQSLPNPCFADFVHYEFAKRAEEERKTRIAHEKFSDETATEPFEELQTDEQLIDILDNLGSPCPSPEATGPDESESEIISATEEVDLIVIPIAKGKRKAELSERDAARRCRVGLQKILPDESPKRSRKKSNGKIVFTNAEIEEIFTSDYVQTVQANQLMKPAPTSKSGKWKTVMAGIVSQVPVSGKDAAISDGKRIVSAARKYSGRPRPTEEGWKVKGMDSLLLPYQVCAPCLQMHGRWWLTALAARSGGMDGKNRLDCFIRLAN